MDPEEIPDEAILFFRICRSPWFDDGELNTAAFRNTLPSNGMSTDWNKYSTALETRRRSQRHPPEEYAVVQLPVGRVRAIPDQTVQHSPKDDNRAHTDVFGDKKLNPEIRVKYGRLVDEYGYAYRIGDPDQ